MIGIKLQGQLGNQMFQYAAARIQSERLSCGLVVEYPGSLHSAIGHAARGVLPQQLFKIFPDLRVHPLSRWLAMKALPSRFRGPARQRLFPSKFQPRLVAMEAGNEIYDDRIWSIEDRTWLSGYFQSPRYLTGWEDQVGEWFGAPQHTAVAANKLVQLLPESPTKMIAVHVRLGDYLGQCGSHGDPVTGWALPKDYYVRALSRYSDSTPIALFSDDAPAAAHLLPRAPAWTSTSGSAAIDMFLMGTFRRVVIANSSFSWWAAWLSRQPQKEVVAPQYHIGWRTRRWFPADIKVEGWTYV